MFILGRHTIVAICVGGLAMLSRGQPAVHMGSSPDPRIGITPISASDPASSLLSEQFANLSPISFYLSNSGRPILSVVLVYKLYPTFDVSVPRTARFVTEAFQNVNLPPVIQANSKVLVVGSQFLRPDQVGGAARSQGFVQRANRDVEKLAGNAMVAIQIDSVIFSDGEVVGPDATAFTSELTARKAAASAIVALANQAKLKGVPVATALADILATHPNFLGPDKLSVWKLRYAQNLIAVTSGRAFSMDDYLRYLTQLPTPPALFNTTTGGKP
jgi:hypothetical protein